MRLEIADIATDEKKKLHGFKVLGLFPFYLKFMRTGTHVKLSRIRAEIDKLCPHEPTMKDFIDVDLQEKVVPLINEYCVTALVNGRKFSKLFRFLLKRKIKNCGHYHILNIYNVIQQLDEPAFFLAYWSLIRKKDNTLLKEVIRSSADSSPIKKKQE